MIYTGRFTRTFFQWALFIRYYLFFLFDSKMVVIQSYQAPRRLKMIAELKGSSRFMIQIVSAVHDKANTNGLKKKYF